MKDYTKDKKLAEMLQNYKKLKEFIKTFDNDMIAKKMKEIDSEDVLSKFSSEELSKVLELFEQSSKLVSAEKKVYTDEAKTAEAAIGQSIMQDVDNSKLKSKEVILPLIGTIKCTREQNTIFSMDDEKKGELVRNLVDEDMTELLTVDVDKYIAYSDEFKKNTGKHLAGVIRTEELKTKITLSRKKTTS